MNKIFGLLVIAAVFGAVMLGSAPLPGLGEAASSAYFESVGRQMIRAF